MDSEGKFWLGFFGIVGAVAVVLILSLSNYYGKKNALIADMVKGGADPVAVTCALDNEYGHSPSCIIIAVDK